MNEDSPITEPARKGLKTAAKVLWSIGALSQMPQPNDFARMITSDILYFTGRVQKLSKDLNKVMSTYDDIPIDFIIDNVNSMFDSTVSMLNKVENRTNNINNYAKDITRMEDDNILTTTVDLFAASEDLIKTTEANVKHTSQLASNIGSNNSAQNTVSDINNSINNVNSYTDNVASKVTDITGNAKNTLRDTQSQITGLLNSVKKMIKEFSESVDSMFGIDSMHSSTSTFGNLSSLDRTSGNDFENMAATAISATTETVSSIINDFSIGRFITGCTGIITTTSMMESGIMKLPRINVEKMLNNVTGKIKTNKTEKMLDDLVQYDPETFNRYKKTFDEELRKQRNAIKNKLSRKNNLSSIIQESATLKAKQNFNSAMNNLSDAEKNEIKSAIKEIKKQRRKARKAKIANKIKDTLLADIKRFASDMKIFFKNVKKKWNDMIKRYETTIKEIKSFWIGGKGNEAIDKICKDINLNVNEIIKICTIDLPVQITNVSVDVSLPRAFGTCVTNIAQHIVQFFAEVKVIIKFISDLMKCIIRIIKDIKDLLQLLFNGINNLLEIINQLKDLCSLKWLFDLIKKIKGSANNCIQNSIELMENSLQPIYFKDTITYEKIMDKFDEMLDMTEQKEQEYETRYKKSKIEEANVNNEIESISDAIEKQIDEFEENYANIIVAYKSIVFKRDENGELIYDKTQEKENAISNEYGLTDGLDNSDIKMPKIDRYNYFHPNLDHINASEFKGFIKRLQKRRRKKHGRFISKCCRRNNSKNGGVLGLKNKKNIVKNKKTSAYDLFYWYYQLETENTFFLSDYDKFEEDDNGYNKYISNLVSFDTKKGSVVTVELPDGKKQQLFIENTNVKTGDYVNYNGNRYKIV